MRPNLASPRNERQLNGNASGGNENLEAQLHIFSAGLLEGTGLSGAARGLSAFITLLSEIERDAREEGTGNVRDLS